MHVTLGEAARQAKLSKSTLSRAIRDGKISAERSPDTNSYRIDASELQRYLDATAVTRQSTTVAVEQSTTLPDTGALEAQIEGLRRVADLLQRQLDDALSQRDHWQEAFRQQQLQLPAPQSATPLRRWWWRRSA